MFSFSHCPRCGKEIKEERRLGDLVVCECGWTGSADGSSIEKEQRRKSLYRTISYSMIGALVVVAVLHINIHLTRKENEKAMQQQAEQMSLAPLTEQSGR